MLERWKGPIVVGLILAGVVLVLALNLNLKGWRAQGSNEVRPSDGPPSPDQATATSSRPPAGFREYPIGDDVERNQIRITPQSIFLPVQMEGMNDPASSALIHLEADIHATEANRNGFGKDEFVPYLRVHYTIVPAGPLQGGKTAEPIQGAMMPMVARDGLHYGATIDMPLAGRYKLDLCHRASLGGGAGAPCRPGHRRRPVVEALRRHVRLGLSRPSQTTGMSKDRAESCIPPPHLLFFGKQPGPSSSIPA